MKNRIRELRLEKGLRQKDVAEQLGVSAQSFSFYENWVNKPDPETLAKIADIFEVSIDYLLCREDEYGNLIQRIGADYSEDEEELIVRYRSFPEPLKKLARRTFKAWDESEKRQ